MKCFRPKRKCEIYPNMPNIFWIEELIRQKVGNLRNTGKKLYSKITFNKTEINFRSVTASISFAAIASVI